MPVIATTSGTTGTPKVMEFTEELLKARTELTALGKGAKIAECKVVHVAYTPSSSAFKKFEEWGNLNGKKIIGLIAYDKIVETFEKEAVDAIVSTRNSVAHGEEKSMSLSKVESYYKPILKLLRVIEKQCEID